MATANNQSTNKQLNQQMNALSLNTAKESSTTPKPSQSTTTHEDNTDNTEEIIYTNHFPCRFASDITFYQYDVKVEEFHHRNNRFGDMNGREKRRQIVTNIFSEKIIHPTAVCWYDEGSCIYSTSILSETYPVVHEHEDQGNRYRLTINSQSATSSTNDLDQSSIRIIETLIKQALKEQFKCIGSVFYQWDEQAESDGPYDILVGFRQALCLTESDVTLNVDTTKTRFYPHSDLLDFIWQRWMKQTRQFSGHLPDEVYYEISNFLKGVEITTHQSDNQHTYVLTGEYSDVLPEEIVVREQNLLAYYRGLGFELRYPKLYCLKAHKPNNPNYIVDLPIELCRFREWQPAKEDENVKPVPAPPADERFHSILRLVQSCNFRDSKLFQEIQFDVGSAAMMDVPYDILQTRQILSGHRHGFTNPVSIRQMGFLYLTDQRNHYASQRNTGFFDSFYQTAKRKQMQLPQERNEFEIYADRNLDRNLRDYLGECKRRQYEFILCVENCRNPQVHEAFKRIAYHEYGIPTQCANFSKTSRPKNLKSYCDNLLLSVNAKLYGENKQVAELQTDVSTMYIGADVLHSKNNYKGESPSIAAVVASMNSDCTQTAQRVSQQWPVEGRQSEEAILLLKDMVIELLRAYQDMNQGNLPKRVVVYRDGVDDGQLERVQNEEVTAIRNAFEAVYPPKAARPDLTLIVVKKRHHTRLFRQIKSSGEIMNVESGVVVDSCIVNPYYPNFFLNSHRPALGTNKIGNYVVLVNDTESPLVDLEELTYSLCHVDQRIGNQLSESIPSVVHLADAAANNARQLFASNIRPPNGLRARILEVHGDVQNAPNMF
ncbi:unnamed protein product [Adineta ricciae]|uniref:Piwi domain-containing protein n=1 Tax=Adineta ricciae TaxID=249248 RepID=A0A813XE72_ADIRI|nr:unnamed protein product [Adineta ricciae]